MGYYQIGTYDIGTITAANRPYDNTKVTVQSSVPLQQSGMTLFIGGAAFERYTLSASGIDIRAFSAAAAVGETVAELSRDIPINLFTGGPCGLVGIVAEAARYAETSVLENFSLNSYNSLPERKITLAAFVGTKSLEEHGMVTRCYKPGFGTSAIAAYDMHFFMDSHIQFTEVSRRYKFPRRQLPPISFADATLILPGSHGSLEEAFFSIAFGVPLYVVVGLGGLPDKDINRIESVGQMRGVPVTRGTNPVELLEQAVSDYEQRQRPISQEWEGFVSALERKVLATEF